MIFNKTDALVYELFEEQVKKVPDAVAFEFNNSGMTYGELDQTSGKVALKLIDSGFSPGDIAAIEFHSPKEIVPGILGILKAGGGYLPLNPGAPADYIQHVLLHGGVSYYLKCSSLKDTIQFQGKTLVYNDWEQVDYHARKPVIENHPGNPLTVIYQTNSNGKAEGISLSHEKILKWIDFNIEKLRVDFSRTLFISNVRLEMSFPMWFGNLTTGGTVYFYESKGNPHFSRLFNLVKEKDFTNVICPLSFLEILIHQDNYKDFFTGNIRNIVTVGEDTFRFNVVGFKDFLKNRKVPIRWHNYYGFPEINMITTLAEDEFKNKGDFNHIGRPASDTRAYVLSKALQLVSIGKIGELYLAGTGIMDKYHQNETLNRTHFIKSESTPDPVIYKTGYKAFWLQDSKLSLVGRTDNIVNLNGNLVAPEEVEAALFRHPFINDCAVTARKVKGEPLRLTAYLVQKEEVSDEDLEEFLRNRLPEEYFPVGFVRLSSLPRTSEGVVDRRYLGKLNRFDSLQVKSLEKIAREFPQVEQAAVVVKEKIDRPIPLHLKDYLPVIHSVSLKGIKESSETPSSSVHGPGSSAPAIIHGRELVWEEDAPRTLAEALNRAATQHGDNGVRFIQADGSTHFQSYSALWKEAQQVLAGLKNLGLKPQDKVIFQFNRNEDFVSAFWGCMLAGVVPVPLMVPKTFAKTTNEAETLKRVWELLDKPIILTNQQVVTPIRFLVKGFQAEQIEHLRDNQPDKNWHKSSPEDVAIILFTSGSTGIPKGVIQCHRSILARERSTILHNSGGPNEVSINWMPLEHVGGVVMFHLSDVYMGCQQIQVSTEYILSDSLRWLDITSKYKGTITWAPNFAYSLVNERVERTPEGNWDLSSMRFILNGGEAINVTSVKKFLKLLAPFGLRDDAMKPAWGMSETCSGVVYSHLLTAEPGTGVHYLDKQALSSGVAKEISSTANVNTAAFVELGETIPGMSIRIIDPANRPVKQGIIGRLQIKGPTVTPGYYKNPELNKEVFTSDGWFDTGDLAFISNGRMTITGRAKDVIIVHGINLNSMEIEAAVEEVEGVETSFTAACAFRDETSDTDRVVVFYHSIYPDFSQKLNQIKQIQKKFAEKFGLNLDVVVPVAKEDIPKTSIGKIQRLKLARSFQEGTFDTIVKQIDIGLENENTLPLWFFKKSWRRHDIRLYDESDKGIPPTCLIFEDGLGLSDSLVVRLEKENCRCIRVKSGGEFKSITDTCYQVDHRQVGDYRRLIKDIEKSNLHIDDIFHLYLYGNRKYKGETIDKESIKDIHSRGIYSLLHLLQALEGRSHRIKRLFVVTSDTQFTSDNDRIDYEKCSITGFLKSVSLELDWLHCNHVDLDLYPGSANTDNYAQFLVQEWKSSGQVREVAYRTGRRLLPFLARLDLEKEEKWDLPIKKAGIYLVTGGLGGIGTYVCKWLLENYAAKLLILGRIPLPEKNQWRQILNENTIVSRRLQAYLELEASKSAGEFIYAAGDIADISFLGQCITRIESQWQDRVAGVFHLAGNLTGSGNIENHWAEMDKHWAVKENAQTFEEIFQAKVYGTLALHQILTDRPDTIFVAFSSSTSFFGSPTFSAYSAANSFLDGFCLHRKTNGWPNTYCINWSSWGNVGMSENNPGPMVKAMLANGYEMILPRQGIQSMLIALRLNPRQLFIGLNGINPHILRFMAEYPAAKQVINVYYTVSHRSEIDEAALQHSILPMISSSSKPDYTVLKLHHLKEIPLMEGKLVDYKQLEEMSRMTQEPVLQDELPQSETELKLAKIWQEILGKTHIGIHDNFFELGGHSLNATTLVSSVHKTFNIKVPLEDIFTKPTIKDLSQVIKNAVEEKHCPLEKAEKKDYYVLSSAQKRLYVLQQMVADNVSYNIPTVLLLEGELDKPRLENTFRKIIRRHDSIRTSFLMMKDEPMQQIHEDVDFKINYCKPLQVEVEVKVKKEEKSFPVTANLQQAATIIEQFVQPFDLSKAPLLRVGLIKLETGDHILLIDMHHIISDGVSTGVLAREFLAFYGDVTLPALMFQYKDYAEWQNRQKGKEEIEKQQLYWLSNFQGDIPVLNLFTDYPRPLVQSFEGSTLDFDISEKDTGVLRSLVLEERATLFMVLLSVYNILLSKLSGQQDIIVGAPIAARRYNDLQKLIGMFVNTLALRNYPGSEKTFRTFLKEVKTRTLAAYENQEYPFEDLVEKVPLNRDASRNPLFDVSFVIQNVDIPEVEIPGLKLKNYECKEIMRISKFDLTFMGFESEKKLDFIIEYSTKLFKRETIDRYIGYFKNILSQVIEQPERAIMNIDMISEQEKHRMLYDFNDTTSGYPGDKTISGLFVEQAEQTPDRIAAVHQAQSSVDPGQRLPAGALLKGSTGDIESNLQLTYKELNRRSNQLAHLLVKKGVQPDTMIGIMAERSLEAIIGILAILKAGGAYLPLEPDYPGNRVRYMLEDSQAPVLLTQSQTLGNISSPALSGNQWMKTSPYVTDCRPQVISMDGLPIPDRSLVDYQKYNRYIGQAMVKNSIALQATRGCPYNCAYCHKIWPKKHITRPAENIFEEVKLYYNMGIRRFVFIDDIFNLNIKNSARFFELIIENRLKVQLFFPNGLRGDILTRDYIDLMVKAGTVSLALALETASPRLQKMIGKNLNLKKLKENIEYFCQEYPQVILELFIMHGFPSETREEAALTLNFVKELKWLHFPYFHILKIYPHTDMEKLALDNGISRKAIARSQDLAYHELPETLPFENSFTLKCQADFFNNYFMSKERLLHVLPYQMKLLTEDEILQKYNSYLPVEINCFDDLLEFMGISQEQLGLSPETSFPVESTFTVVDLNEKIKNHFPVKEPADNALKVLLLDLSQFFSSESHILYDVVEPPLGLMSIMTHLNQELGARVCGKIAKSRIDFDCYAELKQLLDHFQPDVIGIRTLTYYKDFFHKTVVMIRNWGYEVPIIAGGPYVTSDYITVLQDSNVDLVVLGEGEITFCDLIQRMIENNGQLPGEEILKEVRGIAFVPGKVDSPPRHYREILVLDALEEELSRQPTGNPEPMNQPLDTAYVIYTSGTTGKSKGVLIPHNNVVRLLFNDRFPFDFDASDVWTLFHSIGFDFSVWEMYGALVYGGKLVIMPKTIARDTPRYLDLLKQEQVTVLNQTPSAFYRLAEEELDCPDKKLNLRYVIFGGEALKPGKLHQWKLKYPQVKLVNMFGITETTVHVTYKEIGDEDIRGNISNIGTAIPTLTTYVLDRHLKVLPPGVAGECYVGGEGVGRGYLNQPGLTRDKFIDNPYKPGERLYGSGDLVRRLSTGDMEYLGRIDHQVKIRGFRIELGEIENQLLEHHLVKDTFVMAGENKNGDRYLAAYYIPIPGTIFDKDSISQLQQELKAHLSRSLPDYMIPTYFMAMEEIPLSPNGKVDRKVLPKPETIPGSSFMMPCHPIEQALVKIWQEVLGRDELHMSLGIHDNFFELGGHSLNATVMVSRIHKTFNVKIPLADLFTSPTIKDLSLIIKKVAADKYCPLEPVEAKEYYALSSAQKRLYVLQQMEADNVSYNIPSVLIMEGEFTPGKLKNTFMKIINRHDSLRTSYFMVNNEPVQQVHHTIEFEIEIYHPGKERKKQEDKELIIQDFIRPFDLSEAPLVRVGLIPQGKESCILMIDLHHIAADGISTGVLINEFMTLYGEKDLPDLKYQYIDYVEWQHKEKQEEAARKQETYWMSQFRGEIPVLNLYTDYPRPMVQSFAGDVVNFQLTADDTGSLRLLASNQRATMFMVLLAVYNILLTKLSGQEDIIVGSPIAARRHTDLQQIIGMFVNTLAMRNYPRAEKSFTSFLENVKERTLEVYENQEYPFEDLVEKVVLYRDASRNPLFDVLFALQNLEISETKIPGLKLIPYESQNLLSISKFDLSIMGFEAEKQLIFSVEYCTKLFKRETIIRYISYLKRIVSAVIEAPNRKISDIEIVSDKEKRQLLCDFNDTTTDYPKYKTIQQCFEEQVEQTPHHIAAVDEERQLAYNRLDQEAGCLARVLRVKGVDSHDIVGIMLARSMEMLVAILAILKAGGAYLPVDPEYPEERKKFMLRESSAAVFITTKTLSTKIEFGGEILYIGEDLLNHTPTPAPPLALAASGLQLAYVIYTSGTTGNPKGVLVTHSNVLRLVNNTNFVEFSKGDRILQTGALEFDASTFEIWGAFLNGLTLYLLSKEKILTPTKLKKAVNQYAISTMWMTSPLFNQVSEADMEIFAGLKNLLVGGAALSPPHINRLKNRYPRLNIINGYGPTENTTFSTTFLIDREYDKSIPIGKPIANSTVYITDKYNKLQPPGVVGELCVGGDGVALGYLNDSELTAKKFLENPYVPGDRWYRTGDLTRWLPGGNIEYLGRMDSQIKLRGFRIELEEIQNQLLKHREIKDAVVILREDNKKRREYLCAYVVSDRETLLSASQLREFLSRHLPDYMIPAFFVPVKKIPLTPNGKVDRRALPEPEADLQQAYESPGSFVEKKLTETWQQVLGLDRVGMSDNFFEVGGDSIKVVQIASRLQSYGLKLDIADIFVYPTIKELAKWIKQMERTADQGIVEGEVQLTPIQKWFFENKITHRHHFNQSIMIYRPEGFEQHIIRDIFQHLVTHHDALRMVYQFEGKENRLIQRNRSISGKLFNLSVVSLQEIEDDTELEQSIEKKANRIQAGIDLTEGPLVHLGLFKTSRGDHLLMAVHHLVIDGISWRILLEDFSSGYRQTTNAETIKFPHKTNSFKEWAQQLKEYAESESILKELEYWKNVESIGLTVAPLPKDFEISDALKKVKNSETIATELDVRETDRLLKKVNKTYSTEINDILLAALVMALHQWRGLEKVVINLESHGRDSSSEYLSTIDISRTVGWFTSQHPVVLDISKYKHLPLIIKQVKETLRQSFNKAIGYGILRYLTPNEKKHGIQLNLAPEINFNYLGEFGTGNDPDIFQLSTVSPGNNISPGLEQKTVLDINCLVAEGKFMLSISYNKHQYKPETIQQLIRDYKENLLTIIEHCVQKKGKELTPSDLTYPGFSIEELETLIQSVGALTDIYELTPMQSGILFHALEQQTSAYFEQTMFSLKGDIKKDLLEDCLNRLIERYDVMRTVFYHENLPQPLQIVLKQCYCKIYYREIDHLRKEEQNRHLKEFYIKDREKGFNLSKDLLTRVSLFKTGEDSYQLVWSFHHLLMDGWCLSIIFKELLHMYHSLIKKEPLRLEPVAQYHIYVRWLRKQDTEAGLRYWQEYLKGYEKPAGVPKLPLSKQEEEGQFRLEGYQFELDEIVSDKLKEISIENQVTINTTLQTVWGLLLQGYNNTNDVVFGAVVAGRPSDIDGIEKMVGLFINTIPVRIKALDHETFSQILKEVQREAVLSKSYEYLPLADIQARSSLKGDLFNHIMVFENYPIEREVKNEKEKTWYFRIEDVQAFQQTHYHFDIDMIPGTRLVIKFNYNSVSYARDFVERIAVHFQYVLSQVLENPGICKKEIELISGPEKHQLLYEFNDTHHDYEWNKTLHQLFEEQAARTPDLIAAVGAVGTGLYGPDTGEYEACISYRRLNEKTNQLARFLRAKGVCGDHIVALLLEPSLDMLTGILGILKAGGTYLPIDGETPKKRVLSILEDSGTNMLLTGERIITPFTFYALRHSTPLTETLPIQITAPRPQIIDFDGLPFPYRSLVDYEKYHQYIGEALAKHTVTVQTTRGCPFMCAFCHKIWPKKHVFRSAENIFNEIKTLYNAGVRRFEFIDDIFNLNSENSRRFFELVIREGLDIQMFFTNGLRGDLLSQDFIDLMVKAGTVDFDFSLESASPRIQKLIKKNLDIGKLKENINYIITHHPHAIVELQTIHGFPTETEEEAWITLDFIKSLKWIDFPYVHILRIYPGTDMEKIAIENGISREAIEEADNLQFHQLSDTLPFSKEFTKLYQTRYLNEYILSKERFLKVLPKQMGILGQDELIQKYDSFFTEDIKCFSDLLNIVGISREDLNGVEFIDEDYMAVPGINNRLKKYFPVKKPGENPLKVLLLDISQYFSGDHPMLYDVVNEPLGLMYLLTYLHETFADKVQGKIAKSRIDFNSYDELRELIYQFKPDVIGIRSMNFYKDFFHKTVSLIRQWGIDVPLIAGGPYATSSFRQILKDFHVDIVVLGEGEMTFSEIIGKIMDNNRKLPGDKVLSKIRGIAFVDKETKFKLLSRGVNRDVILLNNIHELLEQEKVTNLETVTISGDSAYVIYTSGSTGRPKGVVVGHQNLVAYLNAFSREFSYTRHDTIIQQASYTFDTSAEEIYPVLFSGGTVAIAGRETVKDIDLLLNFIEKHRITVIDCSPLLLNELNKLYPCPQLDTLHTFISGGGVLKGEYVNQLVQRARVYNTYGPTETTVCVTYYRCLNPPELIPPIGTPIANYNVYILDKNDHLMPLGIPGEICISGRGVTRGYLNNPELTAEKFNTNAQFPMSNDRFYRTGDVGRWLPGGTIEFLGRTDHQVKIRGYRIELAEIERHLLKNERVEDAVVIDRGEDDMTKYLCAYITLKPAVGTDLKKISSVSAELKKYLSLSLPAYMIPPYFVEIEKIPLTFTGKVNRAALPSFEGKPEGQYTAPRNPLEEKLVEIWAEVLNIERSLIGIDSNFFDLGGHSLRALNMSTRINKELQVKLTVAEVLRTQDIRRLSEYIKGTAKNVYTTIQSIEKKSYYEASHAQKRLWILEQIEKEQIAYNIPGDYEFEKLERESFEKVIQTLIQRHEILRTTFITIDNEPKQKVHDNESWQFKVEVVDWRDEENKDQMVNTLKKKEETTPFNLETGPLLRAKLLWLEEERFLFLLTIHHIISDGWSMEVLIKEFSILYDAYVKDRGNPLPPLRIQYKEYTRWQSNQLSGQNFQEHQSYWLEQFAGEIPVLELPTDYPRPKLRSFKGAFIQFALGNKITEQIKGICREFESTLFITCLAVMNVFLYRYTQQQEIIVGTPVTGREHKDLENQIGFYVNMLALRNHLNPEQTFREVLQGVKNNTLEAFEHQVYPFDRLVNDLNLTRVLSHNPLFDVVVTVTVAGDQSENTEDSNLIKENIYDDLFESGIGASKHDLRLRFIDYGNQILVNIQYNPELFKEERVIVMKERLMSLITDITSDVNKEIDNLNFFADIEKGKQKRKKFSRRISA